MSGFKQILDLSKAAVEAGIRVGDIPGDGGLGPTTMTIIVTSHGFTPNDFGASIIVVPPIGFASGSDGSGDLGLAEDYGGTGDDKTFNVAFDGVWTFDDGFWQSTIVVFPNQVGVLTDITIIFSNPDLDDFTEPEDEIPGNLTLISQSYEVDEDKGEDTFSFTYQNTFNTDPTGFAITRDDVLVGSVPWTNGVTDYTYHDIVFTAAGLHAYKVYAYKYDDGSKSGPAGPLDVTFGGDSPDIIMIGSGGYTLGGGAIFVFVEDASGIYRIVANKTNDTLYDRNTDDTMDVKIPDPFVDTGFIGG